jgi:hypothetical protein
VEDPELYIARLELRRRVIQREHGRVSQIRRCVEVCLFSPYSLTMSLKSHGLLLMFGKLIRSHIVVSARFLLRF